MTVSVYDLAYNYIKINNLTMDSQNKKDLINTIRGVLNNGANSIDVIRKIKGGNKSNQEHSMFFKSIKSVGNLLKNKTSNEDKMYYHNELRLIPEAPMKCLDINTGEIETVYQDYFLEMKASYTIEDLCKYIKKKEFLSNTMENEARAKGSLKFLTGKYDIDFLLFLIDTANEMYSCNLRYARNILDISDFEREAKGNYERRVTECAISNTDKIVYKKREL